jgi:hypothetical protein
MGDLPLDVFRLGFVDHNAGNGNESAGTSRVVRPIESPSEVSTFVQKNLHKKRAEF